ncbi:MAG: TIGR04282 family arsenosugar biosynthesis glycosyltransferase [Myxococcales bacterium]|nr:TIGR04282 family arsenosugar biosynthesis glycosyltransferase [Myxococcales bacterium]
MNRLMVFAKAPTPGRVKTRLQPPLTPAQAAELHGAFVRDVVARHDRADRTLTVWRAGDLDHPLWADLGVPLATQAAGDLGARMAAAFAAELTGDARVVVLGTDSPTLPPALVDAAFAALDDVPCVVGPACDGGYYLLGARGAVPPVFAGLPWGTDDVLPRTLAALNDAGIPHRLLPFWYDVDRPADLALLRAHLPALAASGVPPPRHTMRALEHLA